MVGERLELRGRLLKPKLNYICDFWMQCTEVGKGRLFPSSFFNNKGIKCLLCAVSVLIWESWRHCWSPAWARTAGGEPWGATLEEIKEEWKAPSVKGHIMRQCQEAFLQMKINCHMQPSYRPGGKNKFLLMKNNRPAFVGMVQCRVQSGPGGLPPKNWEFGFYEGSQEDAL